jgi:RimJ/RimL family protein N-acetyltransferase
MLALTYLELRKIKISDCTPEYLSWILDEDNRTVLSTLNHINCMEDLITSTAKRISDSRYSILGIYKDQLHIGNIQARLASSSACIVSILLGRKEYRGKRYGSKALKILLDSPEFWPSYSKYLIFYAVIHAKNQASINLFLGSGFNLYNKTSWPNFLLPQEEYSLLYEYLAGTSDT